MTETKTIIETAKSTAAEYHKGMTDRYGNPYTDHLERVADRVREMEYDFVDETSEIELYIAAAYLHDVLEDTSCDQQEIFMEFGSDVLGAVRRLSRGEFMTYAEYIEGIMPQESIPTLPCKIARVVKLADLLDHVSGPTPCPPNLKKRYEKSLYRLISKGFG